MKEFEEKGVEYGVFRGPTETGEGRLHARLVTKKNISAEQLIKDIASKNAFSTGDVKGMLEAFRTEIAFHLYYGESVELEGIGTFSVALKSEQVTNEKELVPKKVHFGRVAFKASSKLTKRLKQMKFVRNTDGSRLNMYSPEKRRANLINYLQNFNTITARGYREVNRCSRHIAEKDIKIYLEEGLLKCLGNWKSPYYQLANTTLV